MSDGFIDLRQNHAQLVEESFWPSFTDIMTVVVMIFLLATSILIVKNWELVEELKSRIIVEQKISQRLKASTAAQQKTSQELLLSQDKRQEISRKLQLSIEAEQRTSQTIQETSQENATLEETLTHAQSELSLIRLQLMQARESATERDRLIIEQDKQLAQMSNEQNKLNQTIDSRINDLSRAINLIAEKDVQLSLMTDEQRKLNQTITSKADDLSRAIQKMAQTDSAMDALQNKLELNNTTLSKREKELEEQLVILTNREQELAKISQQNQNYIDNISNYEQQIATFQQQHSVLVGEYENLEDKYNKLIKPSRSAIGKYVVEVRFEKIAGKGLIQFRQSDKGPYQSLSEEKLHKQLNKLKAQYKDTLYVKIIIPDNSGLSYSEAWTFMISLLEKYDYYYQNNE